MMEHLWQPSISLDHLRQRAAILQQVRKFFVERNVLEVTTPCLGHHTVSDPQLASIVASYHSGREKQTAYLQTSPEYHMKRLLATGSGCIFQIAPAFRDNESGRLHNPEFNLLEWYRLDFDHHRLMDEVEELLTLVLQTDNAQHLTYRDVFVGKLQFDPFTVTTRTLQRCAIQHRLDLPDLGEDKDAWLMALFSHVIEPQLQALTFIFDFPATQAALARLNHDDPQIASRFEVYYRGIELANGFHELNDVVEQTQRFQRDIKQRHEQHLNVSMLDQYFLAALRHGLPDCAGVALGLDRLIMLALGVTSITEVMTFPWSRA